MILSQKLIVCSSILYNMPIMANVETLALLEAHQKMPINGMKGNICRIL